jgi:hypothetical protein
MKLKTLAILATFALGAASAHAAGNHDHTPKFGGVVVETKAGDVEIVAKPDMIQIYVSDHGKAVKLDGAKAKVTLLNGAEKTEADLTPAGDKLEAKGTSRSPRAPRALRS